MKRRNFIKNTALGTAAISVLPLTGKGIVEMNGVAVNSLKPIDNQKALVNPDMGWTMHYYSNVITNYGSKLEPSDTLDDFPGLSTVYLRVPWAFIELEEGKFNGELLDTPAQRWIEKGKRIAFRISAEASWMKYATPEWVKNAGAEGYEIDRGDHGIWEPKFDDPVFLEKVENFVAAMAKRYDGKSYVDFVDVGHFGMWGEGHTVSTTNIDYPLELKKKHIDIYLKHFKYTLLCISDDFAGHDKKGKRFSIIDYAFSKGVTIRDDSIIIWHKPYHWFHAEMAQLFWPEYPVILETDHYGDGRKKGTWNKDLLMQAVEDYHASYMSIHWWPREFLDENPGIIDRINRRLGYRLQLKSITYPRKVQLGQPFTIIQSWANAGVAPCYPGGYPCVTLKDAKGGIVSVLTDKSLNMKDLQVAEQGGAAAQKISTEFTIANAYKDVVQAFYRVAKPGNYDVYISVGKMDGTPVFELPYDNNDGNKRYKIGTIEVMDRE